MNYFVNENIFSMNSGTEFSAAQRVMLFKKNKVPAQIVTRNYNPLMIDDVHRIGLEQKDVLNIDRKSTRLNSSHRSLSRMPSSA